MPFLDFKAIKQAVTLERAAQCLNLSVKQSGHQLRGLCPACQTDNERSLALTPSKGVWYCHSAQVGGDVIALVAHVLDLSQKDAAQWLQDTLPQEREATVPKTTRREPTRPHSREKEPSFDPDAFGKKLLFTDEVSALGISEEDALRLLIGFHPNHKRVYFPVRNSDGSIAGFVGVKDAEAVKLPPKWIAPNNIDRIKRA